MKNILFILLGYAMSHLNAYGLLSQGSNPFFMLGIYTGLMLMVYPIVKKIGIKKRKRGYVH
jgi:hypothetical protein